MAISVTCSGCQAAFEVPDELVGKTIRCTTCATQMTVAAAKKPFGWASKSGAAPATGLTPTVTAEVLPADPPPPPAATAPTPAATAPTPANAKPKKSVFDDSGEEDYGEYKDNDDDEPFAKKSDAGKKSTAAAGAAATTASGSKGTPAKKKGNAWKDADDEPKSKPKKKKRDSGGDGDGDDGGGSGRPTAKWASVALVVLAIIRGIGWMLGGPTEPETANNSPPADTTPAANLPGNPLGNPLANATWQSVRSGNLACEMPGTPSERNELTTNGTSVKLLMLEGPARNYAFFVSTVPLPAAIPQSMVPKLLNESAKGAEQGMSRGNGFGGFGRANVIRISSTTDITQDGLPGKELQLAGTPGNESKGGVLRIVLAGREMHMFGAAADHRGMLEPHIMRFMASVKLTPPSTDPGGVAIGQPPKNPPGTAPGTNPFPNPKPPVTTPDPKPPVTPDPQPPIGQPPIGQPPIGQPTEIVGKLKAKLNNTFLAGAFDTGKKELLVVCMRPVGGRPLGAIQRYSYPDFKLVATVNVPTAGTRVAVDSEKGLLYLATTLVNVNTLTQNQFDRSAYQGDVAVYDLAQLRSGKFDDKTELKPLGTVSVSKVIRDVSLSADGKSLYVLANTTVGKPRSQVLQIGTGDRKVTKALDLPAPGWDMVASPDGQKLFVSGLATSANVPPLMVVDLTNMTTAPSMTLPKAAYHLAVAKDGRILTSTIPPAGGPAGGGVGIGGPPGGGIGIGGPAVGGPPVGGPGGGIGIGGPPGGGFPGGGGVGIGGPGGVPPVPGGGPVNACELNAVDSKGEKADVFRSGVSGVSNSGYIGFSPDGKYLICSAHHPLALALSGGNGGGVDVYEVSDKFLGDKKVASMKKAGDSQLGGTFLVSPDGEYAVFNNGAVLKLDDLGAPPTGGGTGAGGGIGAGGGEPPAQPGNPAPFEVAALKKKMIGTWEYTEPALGKGPNVTDTHRMVFRDDGTFTVSREVTGQRPVVFTGEWAVTRHIVEASPRPGIAPPLKGFQLSLTGKGWPDDRCCVLNSDEANKPYDGRTLDIGLVKDNTPREHLPIRGGAYTKK